MTQVLLALGSNVGDALCYLNQAAWALAEFLPGLRVSGVYKTKPMYVTDQPAFLNAAVAAKTDLGPLPLLQRIKTLERTIGRQDAPRFGPREIDIDLIAYGCLHYQFLDKEGVVLEIPHPRVGERRFVLQPLNDLGPGLSLPGLGSVNDLLMKTNAQREDVVKLQDAVLSIHRSG
jgi:2-amino-4-hydroxy-6-hydroxymethyldihydropteridine diphosphokinase